MISREDYERALAARHGEKNRMKLKAASVAVAGLGGLGSNIAILLARVGVGHLHLTDFDRVDVTNIHRQCYDIDDIGTLKTDAIRKHIKRINPFIEITAQNTYVTEDNAAKIFGEYPIVCEAFDRAECKAALVNSLLTECGDTKVIAASGMAGFGSANEIKTRKINDRLYICGDTKTDIDEDGTLVATRAALCAAHQAHIVVRIILGDEEL